MMAGVGESFTMQWWCEPDLMAVTKFAMLTTFQRAP